MRTVECGDVKHCDALPRNQGESEGVFGPCCLSRILSSPLCKGGSFLETGGSHPGSPQGSLHQVQLVVDHVLRNLGSAGGIRG